MKRVLIYSHDTFGLGNIRRMLEVARHLEGPVVGVHSFLNDNTATYIVFRDRQEGC